MYCKWLLHELDRYCPTTNGDMTRGSRIMLYCVKRWRSLLANKNFVTDNWYGGYKAQVAAIEHGPTYTLSTHRSNSKFIPHKLLKRLDGKKLKDKQYTVMVNDTDPFIAMKIRDGSKIFTLSSTLPQIGIAETVRVLPSSKSRRAGPPKKKKRRRRRAKIERLKANMVYIQRMGGVDRNNKHCLKGCVNHKTRSWAGHNNKGNIDFRTAQSFIMFTNTTAKKYGFKCTKEKFCNMIFDFGLEAMCRHYINHFNKHYRYEETEHPHFAPQDIACINTVWKSSRSHKAEKKKQFAQRSTGVDSNNENENNSNIPHLSAVEDEDDSKMSEL